jgi:hypothetical protein
MLSVTFHFQELGGVGSVYNINVLAAIAGRCLVGLYVLPHRLADNHYRKFLLYDLPTLLEDVKLTEHSMTNLRIRP